VLNHESTALNISGKDFCHVVLAGFSNASSLTFVGMPFKKIGANAECAGSDFYNYFQY